MTIKVRHDIPWMWPPPSSIGMFIRIPLPKWNNSCGHCYWEGATPKIYPDITWYYRLGCPWKWGSMVSKWVVFWPKNRVFQGYTPLICLILPGGPFPLDYTQVFAQMSGGVCVDGQARWIKKLVPFAGALPIALILGYRNLPCTDFLGQLLDMGIQWSLPLPTPKENKALIRRP